METFLGFNRACACYVYTMNSKACTLIFAFACFAFGSAAEEADRFDAAPFTASSETNSLVWEVIARRWHEIVAFKKMRVARQAADLARHWGSQGGQEATPAQGSRTGWRGCRVDGTWELARRRLAGGGHGHGGERKPRFCHVSLTPVKEKEFPKLKDYDAKFRYTLKMRVASDEPLPEVQSLQAFTDSVLVDKTVRLAWKKPLPERPMVSVFNGAMRKQENTSATLDTLVLRVAKNPDPNTFDRTLVTVSVNHQVFTFKVDDLDRRPLYLPEYEAAVLPEGDLRDYASLEAEAKGQAGTTLYETAGNE